MTSGSFPVPVPGLVIRYSYLWNSEHIAGREDGRKDRPCAVIVAFFDAEAKRQVIVLPITHTPPLKNDLAVALPLATKRRLGLDEEQSWVALSEGNLSSWPGPDLRPSVNGDLSTIAYRVIPDKTFREIRTRLVAAFRSKRVLVVPRTQ